MFELKFYSNGIEVIDSYTVFWDKETINKIYGENGVYALTVEEKDENGKDAISWDRSKFSLYAEWFIHTLCYRLHIQRDRTRSVYFEFDKSWLKNLFKKP